MFLLAFILLLPLYFRFCQFYGNCRQGGVTAEDWALSLLVDHERFLNYYLGDLELDLAFLEVNNFMRGLVAYAF